MSNITTWANNQFPRPDFHRLDLQPYRLQPFKRGNHSNFHRSWSYHADWGSAVKNKIRTEITIETERVLIIKQRKGRCLAWCPICAGQVPMVMVDEAATLSRVSARTIYRLVESERVHFAETPQGGLLVCLSSLAGYRPSDNPE
jgi:hypothetical protein